MLLLLLLLALHRQTCVVRTLTRTRPRTRARARTRTRTRTRTCPPPRFRFRLQGTNGTEKLWFRGIKNLDATVEWALQHGLGNATELVVTGVSAGGLSSFLHVDRIAARVRGVNPGVRVRGAPVVGFFLDHANFANNTATSYTAAMEYLYRMQNLTFGPDGGVMRACAAAYPAGQQHLCAMSPHMATFVQTPYFVFNSRFDAWQLSNVLQVGSWTGNSTKQGALVQYGADFLTQFEAAVVVPTAPRNGAFISTCICHACPWQTLQLGNKTAFQHYAAWYEGRTAGGGASVHLDTRQPNGGGAITDSLCAAFNATTNASQALRGAPQLWGGAGFQ